MSALPPKSGHVRCTRVCPLRPKTAHFPLHSPYPLFPNCDVDCVFGMSALGQERTSKNAPTELLETSDQPLINPAALRALLIIAPMSGRDGSGSCCHIVSSSLSRISPSSTGSLSAKLPGGGESFSVLRSAGARGTAIPKNFAM